MRKVLFTVIFTILFFILEFLIFNLIGGKFVPNLLLLLIIFITLAFGIRYGILSAVIAGLIKDSFTTFIFGVNIFAYVLCAFCTVFLKQRIYHKGSKVSRLFLAFIILNIEILTIVIIHWMFGPVTLTEMFVNVFVPEIAMTLLVAPLIFESLKKCVLKLFVL